VLQVSGDIEERPATLSALHQLYHSFSLRHRCRIVVLTADLSSVESAELWSATTCYVTASRAEATAGAVQDALAAGRPVIAPIHSAFVELLDEDVAFPVRWHREPTHWPHDPQRHLEGTWARLVWTDLVEALQTSARLVEQSPVRYRAMSHAARRRAFAECSVPVAERAVAAALELLTIDTPFGAPDWAA
jgi:glycosyltransferase involved in cell wall biosynthesis